MNEICVKLIRRMSAALGTVFGIYTPARAAYWSRCAEHLGVAGVLAGAGLLHQRLSNTSGWLSLAYGIILLSVGSWITRTHTRLDSIGDNHGSRHHHDHHHRHRLFGMLGHVVRRASRR